MDDADIAAELAEREWDLALRSRREAEKRRVAMNAGLMCMLCGEEIPEARRKRLQNCCTCFDCQEALERGIGR